MRHMPKDLPPRSMRRNVAQAQTAAPSEDERIGAGEARLETPVATDRQRGTGGQEIARRSAQDRRRLRGCTSAERRQRRLGPLEYTLLALIGLSVAITIAIAILDPSG